MDTRRKSTGEDSLCSRVDFRALKAIATPILSLPLPDSIGEPHRRLVATPASIHPLAPSHIRRPFGAPTVVTDRRTSHWTGRYRFRGTPRRGTPGRPGRRRRRACRACSGCSTSSVSARKPKSPVVKAAAISNTLVWANAQALALSGLIGVVLALLAWFVVDELVGPYGRRR